MIMSLRKPVLHSETLEKNGKSFPGLIELFLNEIKSIEVLRLTTNRKTEGVF